MAKICVFCSSADNLAQKYINAARQTGKLIAERGYGLVYGGSQLGLMGEVSKEFLKYSEDITEIIPKVLADLAVNNGKTIITEDIARRMNEMESQSIGFITLTGGIGTLEELVTIMVAKQIERNQKPLTLVNTDNFFQPYLMQLEKIIEEGFMPKDHLNLIHVASTPKEALDYIENYCPEKLSSKPGV